MEHHAYTSITVGLVVSQIHHIVVDSAASGVHIKVGLRSSNVVSVVITIVTMRSCKLGDDAVGVHLANTASAIAVAWNILGLISKVEIACTLLD